MKKVILTGMLLGLLTGVGVAQRGRPAGPVSPTARPAGPVAPTARPDVDLSNRRSAGVSPTVGINSNARNRKVSPTAAPVPAPIQDPAVGRSTTVAPAGTTVNRNVDPTAAPVKDPLADRSSTVAPDGTVNRNDSPTAASPIRDPK